ncbi:MAG: PP2C family protein-serine/threonine phosphatase [Firmicutes bacterium]|nr:PP2C family protein-serine/threonine phosphatase [Bacillota bacterium]
MPDKSVREMSKLERLHYSLPSRVFHTTILGSLILSLVALLIGLGLYTVALANQYIGSAFDLSRSAAAIIEKVADAGGCTAQVMDIYRSLSDEERAQMDTEAYHQRFAAIEESEDFRMIDGVLQVFRDSSDISDIYLAMYDKETSALVYVAAEADEEWQYAFSAGGWEEVSAKEVDTFLDWDGEGKLHHISKTDKYGWLCTSGIPLKNAAGEVTGFILADVTLGDVGHGIKNFLLQYSIALFVIINLLGYLFSRRMKKTLVDPINSIARAAQDYVTDRQNGITATDHFAGLDIHTGDEVENLSLIMADMERDLSTYEENLTRVAAEKERISTELSLATRIQADMLPNIFPAFPDRREFDIYASMTPAKEVGGDFYDFFLIDDDHLAMVIADVSGKGVPAALFMMASKILLSNIAQTGRSPGQVLETVNEQICSNNKEEMFVTVWLGVLEISSGRLTAANAGHEFPAIKKGGGGFGLFRDKHGFVIGGMPGMRYQDYEIQLEPGDKLFLYTDGVAEATNAAEEMFGTERMLDTLNSGDDAPDAIIEKVNRAVGAFVQDAPQFDDLTMLCLEYRGQK